MYCKYCSAKLDDDSSFCKVCGKRIVPENAETVDVARSNSGNTEKTNSLDIRLLIWVLLPLAVISMLFVSYFKAWISDVFYGNNYIPTLCAGSVFYIVLLALDLKYRKRYNIPLPLIIANAVSTVVSLCIVPIFGILPIDSNILLKVALFSTILLLGITFLIRFVQFVTSYRSLWFILTGILLTAFSFMFSGKTADEVLLNLFEDDYEGYSILIIGVLAFLIFIDGCIVYSLARKNYKLNK